jgi:hypothetical protein
MEIEKTTYPKMRKKDRYEIIVTIKDKIEHTCKKDVDR